MKYLKIMLTAAFVWATAAQAETPPDVMARQATEEVITIVKQDKDIRAGNKKKIHSLVETKILPHFDFERMARLAMGKNWKAASAEQQTALIGEFRNLLVRTYAASISSIASYTFEYKPLRAAAGDTDVIVSLEASKSGSPAIPVDYRVEKQADGWKVYDILVDGVSLITVYRGSFNSEIKKGGVDGLIDTLRQRNQKA
ncbi:MAG: ABC transporter substrate-binding protein [Betaproteobacteria bacterium]|nr:MAG: ABC transporter substrate-binding protein [Betaproteobacteria bacterium]